MVLNSVFRFKIQSKFPVCMDGDEGDATAAGRIRKRRFSTRIQPTRVKKVMQSDEEIGRMVASVPVALGSAMEHFAEKLLESAAQCVQFSAARTLAPMHIRHAILRNRHFSFLEELTKNILVPRELSEAMPVLPAIPSDFKLTPHQFVAYSTNEQHLVNPSMPTISTPFNYDLNANAPQMHAMVSGNIPSNFPDLYGAPQLYAYPSTSYMQPQMMPITSSSAYQTASYPTIANAVEPTQEQPVKRKRGRPRKDRKDKIPETNSDGTTRNGNHQYKVPTTPEEDRILMPPPLISATSRRSVSIHTQPTDSTSPSAPTKTSLTAI
ncbi:CBFD-NFYB-HMF domain-containing protein [Aphelenchoides besseyi]|nr:CBFD-NFYB-HMF domain-containing protein [Aphelenchoides besseyi]KAI6199660.1 CBFD-NFYB-HMF domain-containing protein [Aphelenchoides besseyi]